MCMVAMLFRVRCPLFVNPFLPHLCLLPFVSLVLDVAYCTHGLAQGLTETRNWIVSTVVLWFQLFDLFCVFHALMVALAANLVLVMYGYWVTVECQMQFCCDHTVELKAD